MIAIFGGIGAAAIFATATLCASRSSRMIDPRALVGWVMLVGFAITVPWTAATGVPDTLDWSNGGWLALSGAGNVLGLSLAYAGLRIGKVGVVAPIVSTEGAIAAVIALAAGESISPGSGATLAVIALGIVLAAGARDEEASPIHRRNLRAALLAVAAACSFGASLYATGRVSGELPLAWIALPARVIGVFALTLPLALRGRLELTRPVVPLVLVSGVCEVAGFTVFAVAARHGIAVSAVLASQFAALSAIGAYLLFRERLARVQLAGVATIVAGVAVLSVLQA